MKNEYLELINNNEELIKKIKKLQKEKNAIILAHNYQLPEVQEIADYIGDSLGLSIFASKTNHDIIVFCGVYFMAETAKIISPNKKVLIPDIDAGCPLANMINSEDVIKLKNEHPNAKVICYINSTAKVKAYSDYCCTSANALKMIQSLPYDEFIFIPDKYLGSYVKSQTNKIIHLWKGFCPIHQKYTKDHIKTMRLKYPNAKVMVHPECSEEIVSLSDYVFGTEGMLKHAKSNQTENEYIIGTEVSFIYRLKKEIPNKNFYPLNDNICPNMKKITLEKVLWCLEDMQYEITIDEQTLSSAQKAIFKMLEIN